MPTGKRMKANKCEGENLRDGSVGNCKKGNIEIKIA